MSTRVGAEADAIDEATIAEPPAELLPYTGHHNGENHSDGATELIHLSRSKGPFESELFAELHGEHILSIGSPKTDAFDDRDRRIAEGITTTVEAALGRLRPPETTTVGAACRSGTGHCDRDRGQQERDVDTLRQLHELTGRADEYEDTIVEVLELGCDHFGLERGILSHIDGSEYRIQATHDPSDTFEAGQTLELEETLCVSTINSDRSEPVAFVDVEETEYRDHPATAAVSAYIAAPVTVDGATYGTVNFSSGRPRQAQFRSAELDFVALIAQWVGNEIERQRRFEELQRYETILQAIDDPVYALDSEGRFTFVNEATEKAFGYGTEVLDETVSVGMEQADIDRIQGEIRELLNTDKRSTMSEFELETADGERRIVENRLALIGDDEFQGSAGVLRDITDRVTERRQLSEFRRAVEQAADGVAILDDGEYEYIDQTHIDMYGFDSKDQLLGNTWRQLYDEAEVERLESEAFPALESEGYWVGRVIGSRPDGSRFPVKLSLTIIDDGRLVCTVRDISEQEARSQQLEEFQQAIESAEDGVAILNGEEYEYVDQTHADMYGFDSKDQLLGNTWRQLYDDSEVERLESEVFPQLESEGYWRGMVTGSRPDGSQFPAELSLTIVDDGRLVCTVRDETQRQARKQELETRLAAIEAAIDGIAILDEDGQYTYVNQAHADIYGYDSPEAFVGNDWAMCYDDSERDRLIETALDALPQADGWRGEATGIREDGTTFPQEIAHRQLDDGYICVVRDITDQKARQQELELKERAMDEASVGIQITDATSEDNELVYVNNGFERITGYTADDVLGRNPRLLQGEQVDSTKVDRLRRAIDEDQPISVELQNQRKDGTSYWNRLSVTPVRNDEGRVTNYISIQQDVTDRRERLEQLREYRQRLNMVLSATDTGIADWNLDDGTVSWNETLVELTGQDIDRFEEFEDLVHPDDIQRVTDEIERMIETREPWVGDVRLRCADGEYIWLGTCAIPSYGDEGPVRVLTMATDITDRKERQRKLQVERERFELLIESVDEYAFVILNEDGQISTWNTGAADLYGYDIETAVGMPQERLYPEADREAGLPSRLLQQARIAGESAHEGWYHHADGSRFYGDVRYAPLETDDGDFRGYALVVRDMTDRRQQRRRTELFVRESDDVVCVLEDDGTFNYVSGSVNRVLGHEADALVGESLFDHLHPESREQAMESFFASVDGSEKSHQAKCRFKSGDGEWLTVQWRCRNMQTDSAIDGILLYIRDVTELKERARRFEGIFNQTFQFTGLLDTDGNVIEVNDAGVEFSGTDREDIVGIGLDEIPWWHHSEQAHKEAKTAIDRATRGNFVRYETEVMGGEGIRTIDFSLKPVLDDDGSVSLLVFEGRDVTDKRRRVQHLAVLERVMRHNIRNDLTKLRGWTQMLLESDEAAEREEKYATVTEIFDRWEHMTDRIQHIRHLLNSEAVQDAQQTLSTVVNNAVAATGDAKSTGTITVDLEPCAEATVPAVLEEAIGELLLNAVTASDEEPVTVECHNPRNEWVELTVADHGPGIPDAEADVLVSGEETPLSHGQGLGLWMVRIVITEIGGDVSVDASADGTRIKLRIPTHSPVTDSTIEE